jgi:type 1 glutamine amidotransferase
MLMRIGQTVTVVAVAVGLLAGRASADVPATKQATAPVRVLLLTGGSGHDWRTSSSTLRRILVDTGRFDVRVSESLAGLNSRSLVDFDLVIDDDSGPPAGSEVEAALADFVASGKGLVVTHGGLGTSQSAGTDSPKVTPTYWPVVASGESNPRVRFLDVKLIRPEHPIVKGMKAEFKTADSLLHSLAAKPSAEVLATATDRSGSRDEPVLIASDSGKGRVVAVALGHDASAMHEKAFLAAFARSCEWAATGAVTPPAEPAPVPSKSAKVKALLITGGHDHDAAFYSLFEGYDELDRLPILTSGDAFKKDIRGKYDVIIMYDFTRELDEPARKVLRDFVEGGGGVVVLHHALLNYQSWAWWDDEVVGGSYRLSRPSSAVKDDQQIYVTPVGDHPVTAGLAPFHIQDEAYKNLRMSPKIRPLLTTDNPTSDVNLAWVGPLEGAKVVAIQLGHGPSAFGHPSYRALVHNAVVWAAGKTK